MSDSLAESCSNANFLSSRMTMDRRLLLLGEIANSSSSPLLILHPVDME